VLVFAPNNKQFKIVNTKYFKLYKVRGNEPSIKFRYLQLRNDKDMLEDLKGLYPHMIESFDKYEKNIQILAKRIHSSYISRFIKKEFTTVSQTQFKIIKECHSWHLENREQNRVNQQKVIDVINNQNATHVNHMIKELQSESVSLISSYES
jgi:DNA-binding ferritin-like protein (Dps family)